MLHTDLLKVRMIHYQSIMRLASQPIWGDTRDNDNIYVEDYMNAMFMTQEAK